MLYNYILLTFIEDFTGKSNSVECDSVLVAVMQICAGSERDAKMCLEICVAAAGR